AQQQLAPFDMIDLTNLSPPRTPERDISPEVLQYLQIKPPVSLAGEMPTPPTPYKCNMPESDEMAPVNIPAPYKNTDKSARVVAELDSLCDTLYEMKSNLSDSSPTKSAKQ